MHQKEITQWSSEVEGNFKKSIHEYIQNMVKGLTVLHHEFEVKNAFIDLVNATRNQVVVQLCVKKHPLVQYFLGDDICSNMNTASEIPSFKIGTENDRMIQNDKFIQQLLKKGVSLEVKKIYSHIPTVENCEEQFKVLDHILQFTKGSFKNAEDYLSGYIYFEGIRSSGPDNLIHKGVLALSTEEGLKFLLKKHQAFQEVLSKDYKVKRGSKEN